MIVNFQLNGQPIQVERPPDERVVDWLREKALLTGTKEGCGTGDCGACSVLLDGRLVLSCLTLMAQLQGRCLVTVEGLARDGRPHPLQEAFVEHGAVQCGYCAPGMLLAGAALLAENPEPDRQAVRRGLSGNLCRCAGYDKIVDAVQAAAGRPRAEPSGDDAP